MKEGIVVLSLFDGISCGQIALERAGIKVEKYFASEIDKHAISATQHNYKNTIQIGDITKISYKDGVLFTENREYNVGKIDLLIGGSPCQSFSVAGNMTGFDGKSKLFWEYARVLKEVNPTYFLLENVKMKKVWEKIITDEVGVEPIEIDSSLVSCQNRRRLYWTNIPNITQPKDLGIHLKDILEKDVLEGRKIEFDEFGKCTIKAKNNKNVQLNNQIPTPYTIYEARTEFGRQERKRLRELLGRDTTPRGVEHKEYLPLLGGKANCLLTCSTELDNILDSNGLYRTYTTKELCRLQTVPDDYFPEDFKKTQIRKALGNGWTVDVIAHIFSFIK